MMRQDEYRQVLEKYLLPQVQEWFPHSDFYFMQDGAPCHKAKSVLEWLRERGIRLLEWPGNSPDMNPIENIWEIVKRRINADETITTKQRLIEKLINVWNHDLEVKEHIKSCVESMCHRIEAVIKAKGGVTKY